MEQIGQHLEKLTCYKLRNFHRHIVFEVFSKARRLRLQNCSWQFSVYNIIWPKIKKSLNSLHHLFAEVSLKTAWKIHNPKFSLPLFVCKGGKPKLLNCTRTFRSIFKSLSPLYRLHVWGTASALFSTHFCIFAIVKIRFSNSNVW